MSKYTGRKRNAFTVLVTKIGRQDEVYAPLGYYAALNGSTVPTFRDNLLAQSSSVNKSWLVSMGPRGCRKMSVQNCQSALRNIVEQLRSNSDCGGSLKSRIEDKR
jgi:hypothetical protein